MKRHFSIAFLLATIGNFIIAGVFLFSLLTLFGHYHLEKEIWTVFLTGFFGGLTIIGTTAMPKFRTFIHELKHALMVMGTGNRVKDFHFDTHTGHVQYQMASDKVHFAPIIMLSPYFFPLFSAPTLVLCLILGDYKKLIFCLILGFALASDIQTGFGELHPNQTDIKNIWGGFFSSALYLAGFHLSWVSICCMWVLAGANGFLYVGYVMMELVQRIADQYAPFLSYT